MIKAYSLGGIPNKFGNKIEELLEKDLLVALTIQYLTGGE